MRVRRKDGPMRRLALVVAVLTMAVVPASTAWCAPFVYVTNSSGSVSQYDVGAGGVLAEEPGHGRHARHAAGGGGEPGRRERLRDQRQISGQRLPVRRRRRAGRSRQEPGHGRRRRRPARGGREPGRRERLRRQRGQRHRLPVRRRRRRRAHAQEPGHGRGGGRRRPGECVRLGRARAVRSARRPARSRTRRAAGAAGRRVPTGEARW